MARQRCSGKEPVRPRIAHSTTKATGDDGKVEALESVGSEEGEEDDRETIWWSAAKNKGGEEEEMEEEVKNPMKWWSEENEMEAEVTTACDVKDIGLGRDGPRPDPQQEEGRRADERIRGREE